MKIVDHIVNALTGWIAGLAITVGFSFLYQVVFPVEDRTGQGPGMLIALMIILLIITPIAIAGGVIGGRMPKEGGKLEQIKYAILFGAIFSIPFSCFLFWYTGW